MRLNGREFNPTVVVAESLRPIRLRTGGLSYSMTAAEALELATHLADAVQEFRSKSPTGDAA